MTLYQSKILRKIVLPLFARINLGDITMKHHWSSDRCKIHSFKHKGYWFHGKNRERETLDRFTQLIQPSDTIIEVGGHVGYMSLFFAHAAPQGHVYVFEPGLNNLPYIRENTLAHCNITLIEKGVGAVQGHLPFYMESLTGQNNSFVSNFSGYNTNKQHAFYDDDNDVNQIQVEVVTLDDFVRDQAIVPQVIKIDVEGFEWSVLQGMQRLVQDVKPIIMVEIQTNHQEIFDWLTKHGYILLKDTLQQIDSHQKISMNTFCLHSEFHASIIRSLGVSERAESVYSL